MIFWIARRTLRSLVIGRATFAVSANGSPGLARLCSEKPALFRPGSSCGATPPMASTWPDWRLPVRTPDSGMTLKVSLSR